MGNCIHCEQLQPIRISDHVKIYSFALIPLSRKIVGQSCCCDFCLQEIRVWRGLRETSLANWFPGEGTRHLFELLQHPEAEGRNLPSSPSDTALHALLGSADKKSAWGKLEVSGGITLGASLGLLIAAVAAFVCHQLNVRLFGADQTGTTVSLLLIGPCAGVVLGALCQALVLRRKIPRRMLERVVKDYDVDPRRIQRLATDHSWRAQAVARALD